MSELDLISHQLMIGVGIVMYILGIVGNGLNICVFTIWSFPRRTTAETAPNNTRTGNSSIYLLTTSVANFFLTFYPLLIRILVDGYGRSVTDQNSFLLCKFRYYILQTMLLISLICTCLATFDRYLITSRNVRLRQLSATRTTTMKIVLFVIGFSSLHSIPIAVYYKKSLTGDCTIVSLAYANYYLYFVIVFLYGVFPIIFLAIFGRLTYKQIRQLKQTTRHGHLSIDKQISRMLLFSCIALVFSYIPYCIQNIYFARFVNLSVPVTSFDLLFRIVTIILFYMNPVMNFYILYFSTPNFRHQVKQILRCKPWKTTAVQNQIHTITTLPQ